MLLIWAWRKYPDELQADFARFYGLFNLRALPLRKLAGLAAPMIKQPESWVYRAYNPDWQWDTQTHLLASILDAEALGLWQRGGGKGTKPQPLPRPGWNMQEETVPPRGVYSAQRLDALLARNRVGVE